MLLVNLTRVFVGVVCVISLVIMAAGFSRHRGSWNSKTRDYWYGRVVWTVVGVSACVEGIIRETPFRYTLILIAAAALATLKGNLQKGNWGNNEADE